MYLQERKYRDQIDDLLLLFGQYYGPVSMNLKEPNPHSQLVPRQMVPAQSLINCPVHLCWPDFTLLTDMVYHQETYYFFQNRWLLLVPEIDWPYGMANIEVMKSKGKLVNLEQCNVIDPYYAVYVDYNYPNTLMLIQRNENHRYYLTKLKLKDEQNNDNNNGRGGGSVRDGNKLNAQKTQITLQVNQDKVTEIVLTAVMYPTLEKDDRENLGSDLPSSTPQQDTLWVIYRYLDTILVSKKWIIIS